MIKEKYCIHGEMFQNIEHRINDYRKKIQELPEHRTALKELLNGEKAWKKTITKDHEITCLGHHHLILK